MARQASSALDRKRAKVAQETVARRDPNPRLTRMYREWQQAEERKAMAVQTLEGATAQALVGEAKFKGAVDFIGGLGATWRWDEELQRIIVTKGTTPEPDYKRKTGNEQTGNEIVLNGNMSAKQMKAVMGAQAHRPRKRRR